MIYHVQTSFYLRHNNITWEVLANYYSKISRMLISYLQHMALQWGFSCVVCRDKCSEKHLKHETTSSTEKNQNFFTKRLPTVLIHWSVKSVVLKVGRENSLRKTPSVPCLYRGTTSSPPALRGVLPLCWAHVGCTLRVGQDVETDAGLSSAPHPLLPPLCSAKTRGVGDTGSITSEGSFRGS